MKASFLVDVAGASFDVPRDGASFLEHDRKSADARAAVLVRTLEQTVPDEDDKELLRVRVRESADSGRNEVVALLPVPVAWEVANGKKMSTTSDEWRTTAYVRGFDGGVVVPAETIWTLSVREHADGRRLVCGQRKKGAVAVRCARVVQDGAELPGAIRAVGLEIDHVVLGEVLLMRATGETR